MAPPTIEQNAKNYNCRNLGRINMKLSVVMPTADRAETLGSAIKTVVNQDYDNLQIIVSDNASEDDTREVVRDFNDPRIEYVNPGERLGMASNWEYALDFVKGDYVFFLGDDDGLMPNACQHIACLLQATSSRAVAWEKPNYSWPNSYAKPNHLDLRLDQKYFWMDGRSFLKAIARGFTSYGRLPNLYTSFVSVNDVNIIRKKNNRFFNSVTPDVYSGLVLGQAISPYIYSTRPFSINGGSAKSNGQSLNRPDDFSKKFVQESDININSQIPIISGSIASCVGESFLQAQKLGLVGRLKLNQSRYHHLIYKDLVGLVSIGAKNHGLNTLYQITRSQKLRSKISGEIQRIRLDNYHEGSSSLPSKPRRHYRDNCRIRLDASKLGVRDIYSASLLIDELIDGFEMPKQMKKLDSINLLASIIVNKAIPSLRAFSLNSL